MILNILRWACAVFLFFVGLGYVRHALFSKVRFESTTRILWGQLCAGIFFIAGALVAVFIARLWPLAVAFALGLLSLRIGLQSALRSMGSKKNTDKPT
jgi:hypothetical protein